MSPVNKLRVKIALITGILFGGGFFVAISLIIGLTLPFILAKIIGFLILSSLLGGVIFGLLMSLIKVALHIRALKGMGVKEFTPKVLNPDYSEKVSTALSPQVFLQQLEQSHHLRIVKHNPTAQKVFLKKGTTLKSWGEKIAIKYQKDNHQFNYKIRSRPSFSLTLLDQGANYQNVQYIKDLLIGGTNKEDLSDHLVN